MQMIAGAMIAQLESVVKYLAVSVSTMSHLSLRAAEGSEAISLC
jgi:hypothetical protein